MFTVHYLGKKLGNIILNLPGIHNVYNAMASIAVGRELDIPFDVIKVALESLEGVQRRLEVKGKHDGITVVDDYGHHPTEIKTTLQAAKECWPNRRIVVVFQPHRYTRTRDLFDDFKRAFYQSDMLFVLPIYSAGEKELEGVNSQALCEAIISHGHREVFYIENADLAVSRLKEIIKDDDVVLTLGAGNVWQVGENLLKALSQNG